MTLHYTVNEEDYFQYNMYAYDHNPAVKKRIFTTRLLFGAALLLFTASIFLSFSDGRWSWYLIPWVFCALLIVFIRRINRAVTVWSFRKRIRTGLGAEFLGESTLELTEDTINMHRKKGDSQMGYDALIRIAQGQYGLYVYCGSMTAILLPLSAFRDEEEKQEFLRLLQSRSGKPGGLPVS